jgi:hypothetical protein
MSITYARFNDITRARIASRQLRRRVGPEGSVEVLRSAGRLSHHTIPLRMTAARVGTIVGGVIVGLLSVMTVATAMWFITQNGRPIPAPAETLGLALGLSALLGGLAGALTFATDNGSKCQRVRSWLDHGHPVVVVNAERGHEETLRSLGAGAVGKIG